MRASIKKSMEYLVIAMFMCSSLSTAYAKAGCCSSHGGVASCDNGSGFLMCKDGSTSKTCKCDGTSSSSSQSSTPVKSKSKTATATTAAPATATPSKTESVTKAPKGCCSKHNGVGSCNVKTGYFMCKDGTQSNTCKCQ